MRFGNGFLIALIIVLSSFAPLSTDMYLAALPDMVEYFDTNESVMSMTLYGFLLALAVSVLFIGPISDKYGRRPVLASCMVLYIIMSVLCAVSTNIYLMILFRVIQAIGGGGAMVISTAFIKDCFHGPQIASVMTIVAAIGVVGPVLAPVLGTMLISISDWRLTFIVPAAVALFCLICTLLMDETLNDEERYTGTVMAAIGNLRHPLKDGNFTSFLVMSTIFNLPFLGYVGVSAYIYQDMFGLSQAMYSGMLAVTVIIGLCMMFIVQRIQRVIGDARLVPVFLIMGVLGMVLLLTIGSVNEYLFLVSMIPLATMMPTIRTFGFNLLMCQTEGDNGVISSLLNFSAFGFGVIGMVICSMPWSNFVTGVGITCAACCVIYLALFMVLRRSPTRLKGLEGL